MSSDFARPWLNQYDNFISQDLPLWDKPLYALLDAAADKYPKRLALIYERGHLNFKQLRKKAEIFAGALKEKKILPGQRVALMLPNLPQTVIAFWGIIKAGCVVVMVNPLYKEKEIVHLLRDSEATALILQDSLWERVDKVRTQTSTSLFVLTNMADANLHPFSWLWTWGKEKSTHTAIPFDNEHIISWQAFCRSGYRHTETIEDPVHTPLLLQYSGGTTGKPKGVILSHSNLGTNVQQVLTFLNLKPADKHIILGLLPFFHVYGLSIGLILPVAIMATLLPLPRFDPRETLQIIAKCRPTIFPGAPAMYIALLQQKELGNYDLKSIRICMSGSAPLPREIFRRFQEVTGSSILEAYGLTEASPITHLTPVGREGQKINSIGIPLPGTDARIVDMEGGALVLPAGKIGELVIKGPQVMRGYLNQPDETASAIRNEWLYTGDLATMDTDGFFYLVDRKKDMVIVGGYNVYPREVDEVLLEHPKIVEAVSVGLPDPFRGEILKAYIVLREGEKLSKTEIVAWCRNKLASYKVPRQVEFRDALPRSYVGKILRRKLREEEEAKTMQNKG